MSRIDRGRAHDILVAQDWLSLPLAQRENALLDSLETCIEPDPATKPIRHIRPELRPSLVTLYLAMVAWCIAGPIIRIFLAVNGHGILDLLPFMTLALAAVAIYGYFHTPAKPDAT
jgi:hypothetical protein